MFINDKLIIIDDIMNIMNITYSYGYKKCYNMLYVYNIIPLNNLAQ